MDGLPVLEAGLRRQLCRWFSFSTAERLASHRDAVFVVHAFLLGKLRRGLLHSDYIMFDLTVQTDPASKKNWRAFGGEKVMQKLAVLSAIKLFATPSVTARLIYPKMAMTMACFDPSPAAPAPVAKKTRLEERALRVKRLSEHATPPTRGSAQAAGYDLYRYTSCIFYNVLYSQLESSSQCL